MNDMDLMDSISSGIAIQQITDWYTVKCISVRINVTASFSHCPPKPFFPSSTVATPGEAKSTLALLCRYWAISHNWVISE